MNLNGSIMSEQKLSLRQIEIMRHAIGLGNEKLKKSRYDAYRNHFIVGKIDEDWENLVAIGYATKREFKDEKQVGYYVTTQGAKFLTCLLGCVITLEE